MRRTPIVLTATVAGLAGVLAFHTKQATTLDATGTPGTPPRTTTPRTTTPSTTTPSTTTPSTTTPRTTSPPATAAPAGIRSATGHVVQYGYGELSVRVTERGGHITAVTLATLATAESYSQQLADQAVPQLAHEVLSAQSAHVQGISGATYTSEAYVQSVQSALDALRA